MTFRPLGPSVVATALASVSTPANRAALPSTPNFSSYDTNALEPATKIEKVIKEVNGLLTLWANRSCCERPAPARYLAEAALDRTEALARDDSARCIVIYVCEE